MNWRTLRKAVYRPCLHWEQSDCDSCDDDRDFILQASVPFDTDDTESSFVYLVVTRSGHAYLEYGGSHITGPNASLLGCILRAEEWAATVAKDRALQGVLSFLGVACQANPLFTPPETTGENA